MCHCNTTGTLLGTQKMKNDKYSHARKGIND